MTNEEFMREFAEYIEATIPNQLRIEPDADGTAIMVFEGASVCGFNAWRCVGLVNFDGSFITVKRHISHTKQTKNTKIIKTNIEDPTSFDIIVQALLDNIPSNAPHQSTFLN